MSVLNLDLFPEVIASFALCPIGFAFTFVLHYSPLGVTLISGFYDLLWGPYVIIVVTSIISCIIMHAMKVVHQKYKFEHFYLILVGLVLTLVSSLSMILYDEHKESRLLMFTISPGIGFVYVPALVYIHARAKDYRHMKMSLCHFFYFIGFALGIVIMSQYERTNRLNMLQVYGYVLMAITVVAILLIITNEILQFRYKTYFNYKLSTDYNMDYENKFKTIFLKSYFKNVSQNVDINLNNYKLNIFKLAGYMVYVVVIKLMGLVYFYYPLLFVNLSFISGTDVFYGYLISIIGLVVSIILLKFIKIKTNFLVSLILKIISFLLLILFINIYDPLEEGLKIFYWIHSIFLLYGFNLNDIFVLDLTKLKYSEIVLTIGLILEIVVNGTLHYFVITSPSSIFDTSETLARGLLEHIIPIVIVLLIILFITILILPETNDNSVLEIQNIMFFNIYDKKPNGSGTSIQQKEQPMAYDDRPISNEFSKNPNMDDQERIHPNSKFKPQHMQTLSMSSSTATSEFNYRNNYQPMNPNTTNDPYHHQPAAIQRPITPEEPTYDYNQIQPLPIFPRPRPTSQAFNPL